MAIRSYLAHGIVGVAATVSGDLMLNLFGLRDVVAKVFPIAAEFSPHIGAGIGIGVLSYLVQTSFRFLTKKGKKDKQKDETRKFETISDLEALRKKMKTFRQYGRHEDIDPSFTSGIELIISKYSRWLSPDLGLSNLDGRVARIIETLNLYDYRTAKKINDREFRNS